MGTNVLPTVTALEAQAAANGFLFDHLPHCFTAGRPAFDQAAQAWRVPVLLAYATIGSMGRVGEVSIRPARYPDLTALCGEPEVEQVNGLDLLVNPALIVEILSPSTEAFDRGDKFTFYKSIPSFSEYLLVAQHRPHVTRLVRGDEGLWTHAEFNSLVDVVQCASVPCRLALQEIYRDVDFDPAGPPGLR